MTECKHRWIKNPIDFEEVLEVIDWSHENDIPVRFLHICSFCDKEALLR
jgi:hypothetical protein